MKYSATIHKPNPSENSATTTPSALHSRSGALVNAVTPVNASFERLRSEKVLLPAWRSAGT